jgi:hypothetical protein
MPIPKPFNSLLFFDTEVEAVVALEYEAKKLEKIAKKVWLQYQASYSPTVYRRTGKTLDGIKITKVKKDGLFGWQIMVTFEDKKMYHSSYVSMSQPKGHSVMLIDSGWKSKKLEKRMGIIPRFTRYKGYNYLGQVMEEYLKVKHKRVSVRFVWTGNDDYTR